MVTDLTDPSYTGKRLAAEGVTPQSYAAAATLSFDAYRSVEVHLADQAAADAAHVASNAKRDAMINSAIVVGALILAFIVAGLMARAMSRSMRRLRAAAFDIAETRLPGLVDQLSRNDPGRVDTDVAPIPINTRDEIGEVARAFDQVHREAVRLAAEQALLRGNVNAIFTNLSQRNQGLIQRQLTLITELENNEADPDQLENLFRMDHLATRMRRNGENLLVLAGEEPGRQWNQPVPLVDVLRAAASEVEAYDRIELVGIPETDIHGSAVSDLVHLLAELLENATSFSSPQTKVRVTATRLPDGRVMIEIHDKGIGLTAEDFADINHKLAEPPTVDVEIAKRMGLFVVGRLSDRHGIRVQLRPSGEQAGTTSLVMLPEPITHGGGGEEPLPDDEHDFTVSRIVPEHVAAEPGLLRPEISRPAHRRRVRLRRLALRAERWAATTRARSTRWAARCGARSAAPSWKRPPRTPGRAAARPTGAPPRIPHQRDDASEARAALRQDAAATSRAPASGYGQGLDQSYDTSYQQQTYEQGFQGGYGQQGYRGTGRLPENGFPGQPYQGGYEQPYYQGRRSPGAVPRLQPCSGGMAGGQPGGNGFRSAAPRGAVGERSLAFADGRRTAAPRTPAVRTRRRSPRSHRSPRRHRRSSPRRSPPNPRINPSRTAPSWRSTNDEHWQRAESVREPKAGGVTPSGLPRRVPKANLVAGAAAQTPQGGPQVSRAPEDVRGRLSNLRRGVQQGRTAGTDTNGQAPDSRFGGPQNQER